MHFAFNSVMTVDSLRKRRQPTQNNMSLTSLDGNLLKFYLAVIYSKITEAMSLFWMLMVFFIASSNP